MHQRIQTLASCAILALVIGWVLYIGRNVFIPIAFSIFVVYLIAGLARLLGKVPLIGPVMPRGIRYALSLVAIAIVIVEVMYLVVAGKDNIVALAPRYQEPLLAAIQKLAVFLHIESEPTWQTLRQDLLAKIEIQKLVGSLFASASSVIVSIEIVVLYASFLLFEQNTFVARLANLSGESRNAERIRQIIDVINERIGAYLALKTFLGLLLGILSWIVMAYVGLEFATFWAVLIALLNYIPYIGAVLGIALPVAMAFVQFASPNEVLAVLLPLTVIQVFIGFFVDQYVIGNSFKLSPLAILVSLTVWSELWGIAGTFLAIPITAIATIILSEFPGTRPIAILLSRNGRL
jgi:AI-2 transport protein TqsA